MSIPQLISSKLLAPFSRQQTVTRPRLFNKLDAFENLKATLIISPGGYGKTRLLKDWLENRNYCYSWYTLDATDNDEVMFWRYMFYAVKRHHSGFGRLTEEVLSQSTYYITEDIVSAFLSDLDKFTQNRNRPAKLLIVLDNIHAINNPKLLREIDRFIDYLPSYLHLILAGREQFGLNYAARIIRQEARIIETSELTFSKAECDQFLQSNLSLIQDDQLSIKIYQQTKGWIALIQLLCLSFREKGVPNIKELPATTSLLFSRFLVEEIVSQWSGKEKILYQKLALLNKFSSDLVSALFPADDVRLISQRISSDPFLSTAIGNSDSVWHEFHPLIKQWLIEQDPLPLRTKEILLNKAAAWYQNRNLKLEAIEIYLQLNAYNDAALLLGDITEHLINEGRENTFITLLDNFPKEEKRRHPKLLLGKAIIDFRKNTLTEVEEIVTLVESQLNGLSEAYDDIGLRNAKDVENCLKLSRLIRSFLLRRQGQTEQAKQLCLNLADETFIMQSWVFMGLSADYYLQGKIQEAIEYANRGVQLSKKLKDLLPLTFCLSWLLHALLENGKVLLAKKIFNEELEWLHQHLPVNSPHLYRVHGVGSQIYRELNEIHRAWKHYQQCEALAHGAFPEDLVYYRYMCRLSLLLSDDNPIQAEEVLNDMDLYCRTHFGDKWLFVIPSPKYLRVIVDVANKSFQSLSDICSFPPDPDLYIAQLAYKTDLLIYLSIKAMQGENIADQLDMLANWAKEQGVATLNIRILLLKAGIFFTQGKLEIAETNAMDAIRQARKGGYINLILGEGIKIVPLLQLAIKRNIETEYCHDLLSQLTPTKTKPQTPVNSTRYNEPVSHREKDILNLLKEGLNNDEISKRLGITSNTVKTHLKNIYGKLGAKNRTEAIRIAFEK